jgi:hypothetical protein
VNAASPDAYNIIWNSPSQDHHGSMPLGNGDISVNAWVEPSGQLVFYIGKTDSWDDNGRLLKVGRVRVALDPAPTVTPFRQELTLVEGAINVRYGDGTTLRVWVDAHNPVIQVNVNSQRHTSATATIEPWRTERQTLPSIETSDVLIKDPQKTPTVVEPDTILTGQKNRIGWYHHNVKSVGPATHAKIQGTDGFRREDPLLHRTFGVVVTAPDAERLDDLRLRSASGNLAIHVLTEHPSTPDRWLASMEELIRANGKSNFEAHNQWWGEFWGRSWIHATSSKSAIVPVAPANSHPLRVGMDQRDGGKFTGEIRNAKLPDKLEAGFAIEAQVRTAAGAASGRIFDKITPGGRDGFLLDAQGNKLRLIVGPESYTAVNALPAGEWAAVKLVAAETGWQVSVNGKTVINAMPEMLKSRGDDAACVSQMVVLQRFITACAGRGRYPIKFNGSIFVVAHPDKPGDADYRRWGPGYWWQNTRLPYIGLCGSGDFEMFEPLWRMYVDELLPFNKHRTKRYFGFDDAAFYSECITYWGDVFLQTYGWTPIEERSDPLQVNRYHKWEWVAGPELVWMMLDHYEHTLDKAILDGRIVPTATAVMRFFDNYYKTNDAGQLVMNPSQALETWWDCTNPMPEVAGLHAITGRLLALPKQDVPAADRAYWKSFSAKIPPMPTRDTPSGRALAPAERFAAKANIESPELYGVFPFRLCSFDKANRELGFNAVRHQWNRGNAGWCQDDIFAAYLGLRDDARKAVVRRARNSDKNSRFPAFWGPNYDWIPDQDHGGVLLKAFQSMLLQADGDNIFLLPAWPADWDVKFKLHAPKRTTVECEVKAGKIVSLKVTPASRAKDVTVVEPGLATLQPYPPKEAKPVSPVN